MTKFLADENIPPLFSKIVFFHHRDTEINETVVVLERDGFRVRRAPKRQS